MTQSATPILCPACETAYPPSDGYVCTLANYDHFRCPDCGEMTSRSVEGGNGEAEG